MADQPSRPSLRGGLDVDWHCHSTWSDGGAPVAALAEAAARQGVMLGISDHALCDNPRLRTPADLAAYLDDLGRSPVLRGLEISVGDVASDAAFDACLGPADGRVTRERGGTAEAAPESERIARVPRCEYLIASLHAIEVPEGVVHASRYANWRAGLYAEYIPSLVRYQRHHYFESWLRALKATVRRWPVTILGHFCLLPELANDDGAGSAAQEPQPDDEARAWLDATIEICCSHEVAIELNSKSRLPHAGFVARALELGARFSLGSDAHRLSDAANLSYGRALVARLGIPIDRLLRVEDVR